jgi:hypothetical protein
MPKQITLNEQQMTLLAEFAAADQSFQEARAKLNGIDVMDKDFNHASNVYGTAHNKRMLAAAEFAASFAAEFGTEVANG